MICFGLFEGVHTSRTESAFLILSIRMSQQLQPILQYTSLSRLDLDLDLDRLSKQLSNVVDNPNP